MSFSVESIAHALVNIYKGEMDIDHEVEEHLFQEASKIFRDAIDEGYANAAEENAPLPEEAFREAILHSADVFSAFRTHRMQKDIAAQLLDSKGQLKPFSKFVKDVSPYIEHRNRAWLQTEYDTAVIRAQNAAEWKMFEQEKDVYPNLEWIQSTSPDPGADHMIFWGTIRPVDDAFWNEHRPGDRWNCKCELRQTDKNATAVPESDGKSDAARGLETNPAKAEELFSQKHPYYPHDCMSCPFAGNKLMALAMDLAGRKNCHACKKVDKSVERAEQTPNRLEYERLKKDKDYDVVKYDKDSDGVLAIHREHNFDSQVGKFGIQRGEYEKRASEALYKAGHSVRLRSEQGAAGVKQPDGYLDGVLMDIKGIEGNCLYSINRANDQQVHTAILYFHNPKEFDANEVRSKWEFYPEWLQKNARIPDKTIYIQEVVCVENGDSGYEIQKIKTPK